MKYLRANTQSEGAIACSAVFTVCPGCLRCINLKYLASWKTRMALTAKIKLLRVLSVLQCWVAVWLVVLGIVELVQVRWIFSAIGMAIWIGVWVSGF